MTYEARIMGQHVGYWLAGMVLVAFCAYAQAEEMSVTDERPVAKAIELLEQRYHVPITYEDTLYLNDNEIADVTAEVRLDHDGSNPQRVLVPVRRTVTFFAPETTTGKSQGARLEAALDAVMSLVDSYALAGGAGGFTVSQDASSLHVVARAFTDASGKSQTLKPILEAQVSIAGRPQSAFAAIEEVCRQTSSAARVLDVGTTPINLLANHPVNLDLKNAQARAVLESISKQMAAPLSWQLFCGPRDGGCALNVHVVE